MIPKEEILSIQSLQKDVVEFLEKYHQEKWVDKDSLEVDKQLVLTALDNVLKTKKNDVHIAMMDLKWINSVFTRINQEYSDEISNLIKCEQSHLYHSENVIRNVVEEIIRNELQENPSNMIMTKMGLTNEGYLKREAYKIIVTEIMDGTETLLKEIYNNMSYSEQMGLDRSVSHAMIVKLIEENAESFPEKIQFLEKAFKLIKELL